MNTNHPVRDDLGTEHVAIVRNRGWNIVETATPAKRLEQSGQEPSGRGTQERLPKP